MRQATIRIVSLLTTLPSMRDNESNDQNPQGDYNYRENLSCEIQVRPIIDVMNLTLRGLFHHDDILAPDSCSSSFQAP